MITSEEFSKIQTIDGEDSIDPKIDIYYHVFLYKKQTTYIAYEIFNNIIDCGLYSNIECMKIGINYTSECEDEKNNFINFCKKYEKISIISCINEENYDKNDKLYEGTTINELRKDVSYMLNNDIKKYILYAHTKGAYSETKDTDGVIRAWRNYLVSIFIKNWKNNIKILERDTVGVIDDMQKANFSFFRTDRIYLIEKNVPIDKNRYFLENYIVNTKSGFKTYYANALSPYEHAKYYKNIFESYIELINSIAIK